MLRNTVPDPYSGVWKSLVAVEEAGTRKRQFMRQSGTQTPSKLRLCWMMKFIPRGMTVPGHEDIGKPERLACNNNNNNNNNNNQICIAP